MRREKQFSSTSVKSACILIGSSPGFVSGENVETKLVLDLAPSIFEMNLFVFGLHFFKAPFRASRNESRHNSTVIVYILACKFAR